jgi:hypothetical protein
MQCKGPSRFWSTLVCLVYLGFFGLPSFGLLGLVWSIGASLVHSAFDLLGLVWSTWASLVYWGFGKFQIAGQQRMRHGSSWRLWANLAALRGLHRINSEHFALGAQCLLSRTS